MTVISCVISRQCAAHASDSFLTTKGANGLREPIEKQLTKIVRVPRFRGVMAYWGLAHLRHSGWSTLEWLRQQAEAARHFATPEDFAGAVAEGLNRAHSDLGIADSMVSGTGIHFTAYECVDRYWIPELFLLSNYSDPTYSTLRREGVGVSRETFSTLAETDKRPEHRKAEFRLAVHSSLQRGDFFFYNNGDPILFNPAASAIFEQVRELARRGALQARDSVDTWRHIARTPIELVSTVQTRFARAGSRLVGGRPHDLAVTPDGRFFSSSGD